MQKAQKPLSSAPGAPLLLCGLNDKSLTGHDIRRGFKPRLKLIGGGVAPTLRYI